jgi:hypothetical protein
MMGPLMPARRARVECEGQSYGLIARKETFLPRPPLSDGTKIGVTIRMYNSRAITSPFILTIIIFRVQTANCPTIVQY